MRKKMCVLTKSLKDREYCVAGIDIDTKKWIRLVSSKSGDAIPKEVMDDEKNPINILDIVSVELKEYVPHGPQTENWLLDDKEEMYKLNKITLYKMQQIVPMDNDEYIFFSEKAELEKDEISKIKNSLIMIKIQNLKLDTSLKGDGRNHHKASFKYNCRDYTLSLTDPEYRNEELDGIVIRNAIAIISIPAIPYENGLYYKFIAKIFVVGL
jgi:hypothetical protein